MCGGAFEGMQNIVEKRVLKDKHSIGFRASVSSRWADPKHDEEVMDQICADDLLEYGFIPEFVGRLPVAVALRSLDKDALIKVLTEPKNSFVKQYQALFDMEKVELVFTEEALDAAAERALLHKTGARGLRTILEQTLLDVMYELPSMTGVSKCLVDADAILGHAPVSLVTETGEELQMPSVERKSA